MDSGKLQSLKKLPLQATELGDTGLETISQLSEVRELNLSGTQITDAGMSYLAKMTNLQYLGIWPSEVSDVGLLQLKPLLNLDYLMVGPHITEAAAKELQQTIPSCRLDAYDAKGIDIFHLSK